MIKNIKETITKILADQTLLDPEDITDNLDLAAMGIDSLAVVEIIFAIEETFNITIPFNANEPNNDVFDISSVKSIIAAVEKIIETSTEKNQP